MVRLEKKRRKIKEDPFELAEVLYPDYQFEDFHKDWLMRRLSPYEEITFGPRNFGKTTVGGIIGSIWLMSQDPNIQLGIVSDTSPQAIHFASEIKMHCEQNKLLRLLYPYLAPGKLWSGNEFTIAGATKIQKGATMTTFGYGGGTGYEFDDILADDIVDFENVRTKYQRDKLEDWIGMSLRPMLKSNGILRFSGTRYHDDDMYGRLLNQGIPSNQQANTHKAIQDNGESLWPELWPIEKLLAIKDKIGSMRFNAQYQNDTTLMKQGKIFKREWFKYFNIDADRNIITDDNKKVHLKQLKIYQTCDLAISLKQQADYFVILTFGIDKEGNIYILNILRNRYSWEDQKKYAILNYRSYNPIKIGIESNQYQRVFADELNQEPGISVKYLEPVGDKATRAMSMSAKYETGKVYHFRKMSNLQDFEDELTAFPEGEHDDMVDADAYITQMIEEGGARVRWL